MVGSPITCAPGTWANAAALGYTFLNEATGAALQAGPAPSYTPPDAARGATVSCIVTASSAGGTSTAWSGVSAAVQADVVPPKAVLRSVRCRKRRCTVKLAAADPNSQGALKVRVTAERRVRTRCGKRKRPCSKTRSRSLEVVHGDGHELPRHVEEAQAREDADPRPRGRRRGQPAQAGPHQARPHPLAAALVRAARTTHARLNESDAVESRLRSPPARRKRQTLWAAGLSPRWPRSLRLILRVWVNRMSGARRRARPARMSLPASSGKS